jgi:septum formation protein
MKKIILGSASPRRKELLTALDFKFEVRVKDTDESCPAEIPATDRAVYIAKKKAEALRGELNVDELLICADTVVIIEDTVLNKPQSAEDAFNMLLKLSGKSHHVVTGVVVCTKEQMIEKSVVTTVEFETIPLSAIEYYISNYKPFDKAGAYGIQEWIGYAYVKRIEGSYNNVVGLPTVELNQMIQVLNS